MPNDYYSTPLNSLPKLKGMPGTSFYIYALFRSKLKYKRGLKKLTPVSDIITFTYPEAEKFGVDHKLFSKTIKKLIAIGLIEIVERGKFGGRIPTKYRVK